MKQPNARPAGKLPAATRSLNSPRGRLLDLDDDIFLPADPRPVVRQPAPVLAPRVDGFSRTARSEMAGAAPIEPPRAKAGPSAAEVRVVRLEKTIEEQSQKLSSCHDLILELNTKRDQQTHDLQSARQAIKALEQSLIGLRGAASKRDSELVAAIEKLNLSEKEQLALQAQFHSTHRDYMQVADRLLVAETTLNDQSATAAAAQDAIDRSNAELELHKFQIVALETELKSTQEQRRELREQAAQLQSELGEQTARLGEQESLFRDKLGEREAWFQSELAEQTTRLGEQERLFRGKLDEQETLFRDKLGEREAWFQGELAEQTTRHGDQEARFQCKLAAQEALFRSKLGEREAWFRSELAEQTTRHGEQEALFRSKLSEQEAQFQSELAEQTTRLSEQESLFRGKLVEQETLFRHALGEGEAWFRSELAEQTTRHGEREALFLSKLAEQEAQFRSELAEQNTHLGEQEALFRKALGDQERLFRSKLGEQEAQFRNELSERTTRFQKEIEIAKAISQESIRQATAVALDRAALQQRCEELSRAINLLQAARRRMNSELQINAGDLGQLHADISEMKESHNAIAKKFEQAETKLSAMRLHVEKLETSHSILARYDTALVDSAAANGSTSEQARELQKSKNEIFELLEAYFEDLPASDRRVASSQGMIASQEVISGADLVSGQGLLATDNPLPAERAKEIQEGQPADGSRDKIPVAEFQFAELSFLSRDEQGADIIKLETAARGKKVA
ncbi:hypothetical protein [Rhodoplanes sp. Z2-YC6860]|uniref:hypothetical protein n=1 Tax=Rhodoplanes sp. Z2-YC6860 TaxID=674703 RepID=UPI00078B5E70|nr:hypothetical protein [Rhodoplanes sp. Z2-YC6860]AMN41018.1 hypothetical protein RHPLAN_25800 [Rhodoplanes sp. Z2-YC6860]